MLEQSFVDLRLNEENDDVRNVYLWESSKTGMKYKLYQEDLLRILEEYEQRNPTKYPIVLNKTQ